MIRAIATLNVDPARARLLLRAYFRSPIRRLEAYRRVLRQRLHARSRTVDLDAAAEHKACDSDARGDLRDGSCPADVQRIHHTNRKAGVRLGARQVKDDVTIGDRALDRGRIGDVSSNHPYAPLFQYAGLRLEPQQRDNGVPVGKKTVDQV